MEYIFFFFDGQPLSEGTEKRKKRERERERERERQERRQKEPTGDDRQGSS